MTRKRSGWQEDDPPAAPTVGAYTTGLPPETDVDGKPIEPVQIGPIGFVQFGGKAKLVTQARLGRRAKQ